MNKTILSVITMEEIPRAVFFQQMLEKNLFGWTYVFYVLDANPVQIRQVRALDGIDAEFRSAQGLFKDYQEMAFYFSQDELRECVKAAAGCEQLKSCDRLLISDPDLLYGSEIKSLDEMLVRPDTVIFLSQQQRTDAAEVPVKFMLNRKGNRRRVLLALSNGEETRNYLNWCRRKFLLLFHAAYLSPSMDYTTTFLPIDRRQKEFVQSWNLYACVFQLSVLTLSVSFESSRFQMYRYGTFDDGTKILPAMRKYYPLNQDLRDACEGNPFENRPLFTDDSVLRGDDCSLPLTAVEKCVWESRNDLKKTFPDPAGKDRLAFTGWFLRSGVFEYRLPTAYFRRLSEKYQQFMSLRNRLLRKARSTLHFPSRSEKIQRSNLKEGVNLCGFIRGDFGLGEATRILARTFDGGKVPFGIVNFQILRMDTFSNHEWDQKITNTFDYNVNVMMLNTNWVQAFRRTISPDAMANRYNIAVVYWELPEFPDDWVATLDPFQEIWVASAFTKRALKKLNKPIFLLPCCVTAQWDPTMDRAYFELPTDRFLFLMMYDMRSMQERKNPYAVIRAFAEAFGDRRDVGLIIKVNAPKDWPIEEQLLKTVSKSENIRLINGAFSKVKVNSLVNCCDAFVSLHRSEGFGLGPAEAMYFGKPAVLTDWSGNTEYMTKENCCPVSCRIVEIEKDVGPYRKGCHWADPDVHEAADYMKRLVDDRDYYQKISKNGRQTIHEKFSAEYLGQKVKEHLKELKLL